MQDEAAELTAELAEAYWRAHDQRMASTGFMAIARQFPSLVAQAMRLGYEASRLDLVGTVALNIASGMFTGYALLATTGVLQALFAAGPTPGRVRAAIPSLAAAVAARSGLQVAASWAQARLEPQVNRIVELRLFDLTTQVELAAFDDPEFHDAMQRARDRGCFAAAQVVTDVARLAAYERDTELTVARRVAATQVTANVASGIATAGVYVALGALLTTGVIKLAIAGTAVLAIRTAQASLASLLFAVNQCYEDGLYFSAARWSPWSARTDQARPPWPRSWPGCTSPTPAPCAGTRPRSPAWRPSSSGSGSR